MNARSALLTLMLLTLLLGFSAEPTAAFFGDSYVEANEIDQFQCTKVQGKDELRIAGNFSQTTIPITTKLVLKRDKQELVVLIRVAAPPEGRIRRKSKGNQFEYQFRIPRGVKVAVFGRQKRLLWNRDATAVY